MRGFIRVQCPSIERDADRQLRLHESHFRVIGIERTSRVLNKKKKKKEKRVVPRLLSFSLLNFAYRLNDDKYDMKVETCLTIFCLEI